MTFVVYSKTGCENCEKAKLLLSHEEMVVINCDQLLEHNRDEFILSIELKTKRPFIQFPLIFKDSIYLGSYADLVEYLNFELVEDF